MTIKQKILASAMLALLATPVVAKPKPMKSSPRVDTILTTCRGAKVGQEFNYGVTRNLTHGVKITSIEKDSIVVSVFSPELVRLSPSPAVVSVVPQVNGVRLSCKGAPLADIPVEIDAIFQDISRLLSSASNQSKGITTPSYKVDFTIYSSSSTEITLETKEGRRFRLDRRVDVRMGFLTEKAGYFLIPMKIESITVTPDGTADAKLSVDCTKTGNFQDFRSKYMTVVSPGCKKH